MAPRRYRYIMEKMHEDQDAKSTKSAPIGSVSEEPLVKYEMQYVDHLSGGILSYDTACEPLSLHGSEPEDEKLSTKAEDVVFTVIGRVDAVSLDRRVSEDPFAELAPPRSAHITSFGRTKGTVKMHLSPYMLSPDAEAHFSLEIASKSIIRALQGLTRYYHELELGATGCMTIPAPYALLMHNLPAIQAYREHFDPGFLPDSACAVARQTYSHLGLLLQHLQKTAATSEIEPEGQCDEHYVEFASLWKHFKPGTPALRPRGDAKVKPLKKRSKYESKYEDLCPPDPIRASVKTIHPDRFDMANGTVEGVYSFCAAIIISCTLEHGSTSTTRRNAHNSSKYWCIGSVSLNYDGKDVIAVHHWDEIFVYDGTLEFEKLPVFPMSHAPRTPDGLSAMEHLTKAGKLFCDLFQPQCRLHKGKLLKFPHHQMEGLVQVDFTTFFDQYQQPRPRHPEDTLFDNDSPRFICDCGTCMSSPAPPLSRDRIAEVKAAVSGDASAVAKCHFLFPCYVYAYAFKTRDWKCVYTMHLFEPNFKPGMMETLVMQEKRKTMLQALAKNFVKHSAGQDSKGSASWNADFVEGKGNNQIFLLHGPPGVGKTYTAECIAHYTSRPLMILNSSDISVQPTEAEACLNKAFALGKRWDAILLIDEADIYLERRSLKDLKRNSLVASFLRALEVYEGILFLTTNRVGSFDDAFSSRIHVKFHFPALTDVDRLRIWNNFIDKLKHERGHVMQVASELHNYITSIEVTDLKLNGREIRNIFQTAVTLAIESGKDDNGMMTITDSHVAQVVGVTSDFKNYLDDLHIGDEETRAQRSHTRKSEKTSSNGAWSVVET